MLFFIFLVGRVAYTRTEINKFDRLSTTTHNTPLHTHSINTLLFEPAPLLDKAHEGSDSCPRADHDHWVGGLEGQAELRLADIHGNGGLVAVVGDQFVLQPVGGHSLVSAASLGVVLHHYCTDVDAVGVNLQKDRRE